MLSDLDTSALKQGFLKYGPKTNSISITWELVKNVNARDPTQTY